MKQLRFPRTDDAQTWGFDLARSYPRNVRHRFSAVPKDRNSTCALCQVAKITGFAGFEPGRNLELDPTLTATPHRHPRRTRYDRAHTRRHRRRVRHHGILGHHSEHHPERHCQSRLFPGRGRDVAQLEVNERFALFYPERRPFFLEGVDLFSTPVQAVFTRTVVDPSWGLKLTGKEGRHNLGLFVTSDDVNQILIPSNQGTDFATLEGSVESTVVRYRFDVGAGSTLGALLTNRQGDDYHNRVAGVDGFFRFSPSNTLRFQAVASDTRYPGAMAGSYGQDEGSFSGYAVETRFQHATRNWFAQVNYEEYDPGFRADVGFIPRIDTRMATAIGQRTFWGDAEDWYTDINIGAMVARTENHNGQLTDEFYQLYGNLGGPWQSRLGIDVSRVGELYGGVYYDDLDQFGANIEIQPNGSVRFALNVMAGDTIGLRQQSANGDPAGEPFVGTQARTPGQPHHRPQSASARCRRRDGSSKPISQPAQTHLPFQRQDADPRDPPVLQHRERPVPVYRPHPSLSPRRRRSTRSFFSRTSSTPRPSSSSAPQRTELGLPEMPMGATDRTYFIKLGYAWLL